MLILMLTTATFTNMLIIKLSTILNGKELLTLTFNKYFYNASNLCMSTAPYTPSNKSSNVSPSKSWVQLFLRLFLIFFNVNLVITLGLSSFNAIMPKLSK